MQVDNFVRLQPVLVGLGQACSVPELTFQLKIRRPSTVKLDHAKQTLVVVSKLEGTSPYSYPCPLAEDPFKGKLGRS